MDVFIKIYGHWPALETEEHDASPARESFQDDVDNFRQAAQIYGRKSGFACNPLLQFFYRKDRVLQAQGFCSRIQIFGDVISESDDRTASTAQRDLPNKF